MKTQFLKFKTQFAEFTLFEGTDGIYECHCGYELGCFETEPELTGFEKGTPLKEIKKAFIDFYGAYEED